jgi:hypothetical protein
VRGRRAFLIVLAAAAALPASASAERTRYSIVKANGSEELSFESDSATCANFGTCGDSGTVTYRFGGEPGKGSLVLDRNRRGRIKAHASFRSKGTTKASVTSSTGTCTDAVKRRREVFSLTTGSRLSRLLFVFHDSPGTTPDYLRSDCLTPTEAHLARQDALPQGTFPAKNFDNQRTSFRLSGEASFRDRGYRGSVKWSLGYRVKRRG